jgi:hypothetical protein
MKFDLIKYFYPKEIILIDFNFGNETFVNRFRPYIDQDRGYLYDEFYKSKKEYLGEINSTNFFIRNKRKFLNSNVPTAFAKGEITQVNNKTTVEIELKENNEFAAFGKIITHLFLIALICLIIIKGIYPLLILFIPFSIGFLALTNLLQKRKKEKFKENLLNIMYELRIEKNNLQNPF